ncbi:MAG: hypothetical protein QJR02_07340 [Sinobacteraceae bacterium]|nr:hypothetical protein [Nevskiaceae bacterium]
MNIIKECHIGSSVYQVVDDHLRIERFRPRCGVVSLRRNGAVIASSRYECASERRSQIQAAERGIPSMRDYHLHSLYSGGAAAKYWTPGKPAIWGVPIREDGPESPVVNVWLVFAPNAKEAVAIAAADIERRRFFPGHDERLVLGPAYYGPVMSNPSPPSEEDISGHMILGPDGCRRYDLRPYYRGPRR